MCRTVIKNVLVPLVAKYGVEIGLWREHYPGYGLVIEDDDFVDFLDESFHQDFKLFGHHCAHMREAIVKIKNDNSAELRVWIDRKLGEYLTLKTAVRERVEPKQFLAKLRRPRDSYFYQHEQADEVIA